MIHKPVVFSDIDSITKMMQDFYGIDNYPFDIEVSKKLFQEFISNENLGKCWLIYSDNKIVGYVIITFIFSFEYQGRVAILDELYIVKEYRRTGIGNLTIQFIKEQTLLLNVKVIYLEVENHNEKAQKLYLANGFELHNRKTLKLKLF